MEQTPYPTYIARIIKTVAPAWIEEQLYSVRKDLEARDGALFVDLRELKVMIEGVLSDAYIPEHVRAKWQTYNNTLTEISLYWESGATGFLHRLPAYYSTMTHHEQRTLPLAAVPDWIIEEGVRQAKCSSHDVLLQSWWMAGWKTTAHDAFVLSGAEEMLETNAQAMVDKTAFPQNEETFSHHERGEENA